MEGQHRATAPVAEALAWAATQMEFSHHELVRKTPWTKVYLLNAPSRSARLTLTRPELSHTFNLVRALEQRFAGIVPTVIAQNDALGAHLLADAEVDAFDIDDHGQGSALLAAYADLQGKASRMPDLLAAFPALDIDTLLDRLLAFLDSADDHAKNRPRVSAARYLGRGNAARYATLFKKRSALLAELLAQAKKLPSTINHGDLQAGKIDFYADKSCVIGEWEHAVIGPAGVSLYTLFGSHVAVAALRQHVVDNDQDEEAQRSRRRLDAYIGGLEQSNYAAGEDLRERLAGAICAGAILTVLRYADYPKPNSDFEKVARKRLERCFSDLLDICDQLALSDRASVIHFARDYARNGRRRRAQMLLRRYAALHPRDAEIQQQLGRVLFKRRENQAALKAYRSAIKLGLDDARVYEQLGDALLVDSSYEEADEAFNKASARGASRTRIEQRLAWSAQMQRQAEQAELEDVVPTIQPSAGELESNKWLPEQLALAIKLFHQHGVLLIHNVFDKSLIKACNIEFVAQYDRYFSERSQRDALRIGDKRFQISLVLQGSFNTPSLYANPFILALMQQLLGDEFALGCTVCATSLPGAKDQHWHKDHRSLFARDENETPLRLPPFAITTMVPLVELDNKIGTTAVKKGSHLLSKPEAERVPAQFPMVPEGSCFLMDLRLSHRGLRNQTQTVRPILNMVYQRYWFSDSRNFQKHPPLQIPAAEYRKIPREHRRLFEWGAQPGPRIRQ